MNLEPAAIQSSLAGKIEGNVSVNSGLSISSSILYSESLIGVKKRVFWIDGDFADQFKQVRETR